VTHLSQARLDDMRAKWLVDLAVVGPNTTLDELAPNNLEVDD